MQDFLNDAWTSLMNAWDTFPDELFSSNPEHAMVAWTLLATITIPVGIFFYSWKEGKRSSKIQDLQLESLEKA